MRPAFFLAFWLILSGCTSKPMDYTAQPIEKSIALSVLEQVSLEQPQSVRPQHVVITDQYLGFSNGIRSDADGVASAVAIAPGVAIAGGSSRVIAKELYERIYFNSIGTVRLYSKENGLFKRRVTYIVSVRNQEGYKLRDFYLTNRQKSEMLVDSLKYFMANSQPANALP